MIYFMAGLDILSGLTLLALSPFGEELAGFAVVLGLLVGLKGVYSLIQF